MNVHVNNVTSLHKNQFKEEGYLVVEGILSDSEIKKIQTSADNYIEKTEKPNLVSDWLKKGYLSHWGVFSDHMSISGEPFYSLIQGNKRAAEVASILFGTKIDQGEYMGMQVMYGACGCRQGWHQDHWPKAPENRWINCMYYLNDMTETNGSLLVIPGSHQQPLLKRMPDYGPIPGSVRILCPAGTAVFFYMSILHAADENYEQETRRGIKTHYFHPDHTDFPAIHEQHYSRGIRRGSGPVSLVPTENGSYFFPEWDPKYSHNSICV